MKIEGGYILPRIKSGIVGSVQSCWPVIGFFVLWHLYAKLSGLPSLVLPRPADLLGTVGSRFHCYESAFVHTVSVALIGTAGGSAGGYALAVVASLSRFARGLLVLGATVTRSIPLIAIIPLLTVILGYGFSVSLVIALMVSVFPVFTLVATDISAVPKSSSDFFRVVGANRWIYVRKLIVPWSILSFVSATRIAIVTSVGATMSAEYYVGNVGLGSNVAIDQAYSNMTGAWAVFGIATIVSFVLYKILTRVEWKVAAMMDRVSSL